ncbi:MAG: aminotransferase class V-fold PLP-dependent enzyme [Alphaproteobacteria bacterium]|nr:aminotransferase class V-fold PLP-dependent enzyme [Alphaproteobacteria bacterium]
MTNIIYVDSAASALKPESVIRAQVDFMQNHYANAGRGNCMRAGYVDEMVARTRKAVSRFICAEPEQIAFTSGTTDGMNRIPHILKNSFCLGLNPVVVASDLDHHSARMPLEWLWHDGKCKFKICQLDNEYNIDPDTVPRADIFMITAMSNVMGVPQNVKKIIKAARDKNPNVITIIDAAQYAVHFPIDVKEWDCDFLCFSGHKIGADTGIGVMYMKKPNWHPDKFGGGMVENMTGNPVTGDSKWAFASGVAKFEAGTLPLTQIAGLHAAIKDHKTNQPLLDYLRSEFTKIPRVKFISPVGAAILTFTIDGMHPLDFGAMMGAKGICLRVGNMCASWLHRRIGIDGSIRISVGSWNTMEEMEKIAKIAGQIIK